MFSSITYPFIIDEKEIDNYLEPYPFKEKYDEKKDYPKEILCDFGYGTKTYQYHLYCFTKNNKEIVPCNDYKYVVAKEVLSEKELKQLSPYCQCLYHKKCWWNPIGCFFICKCCVGCIDTEFYSQDVVNKTREHFYGRFKQFVKVL